MSLSFACENAEHDKCLRPSCTCWCGHKRRAELHAEVGMSSGRATVSVIVEPTSTGPPVEIPTARSAPRTNRSRPAAARSAPRPRRELPIDEIVARYAEGDSIESLARRYDCSSGLVRSRLAEAGTSLRASAGRGWRQAQLPAEAIVERYRAGDGLKRLAALYDVATGTIRALLTAEGVEIRRQGDRSVVLPDDVIVDEYLGGRSLEAIARRYNVTASTVVAHLRARGVEPTPGGHPIDADVDYAAAAVAYSEGAPLDVVAAAHGIGTTTLRRRFTAMGVTIRPQGAKPNGARRRVELPISDEELARRYVVEGLGIEALADQLGVSTPTIRSRLVAHGVTIRPPGRFRR